MGWALDGISMESVFFFFLMNFHASVISRQKIIGRRILESVHYEIVQLRCYFSLVFRWCDWLLELIDVSCLDHCIAIV